MKTEQCHIPEVIKWLMLKLVYTGCCQTQDQFSYYLLCLISITNNCNVSIVVLVWAIY